MFVYCSPYAASQMWSFALYLPHFIGDKVPEGDKHWECFICLLEIVRLSTARIMCKPSVMYLTALIEDHHRQFRLCYPSVSMTPKFHYMVHLPRLIFK